MDEVLTIYLQKTILSKSESTDDSNTSDIEKVYFTMLKKDKDVIIERCPGKSIFIHFMKGRCQRRRKSFCNRRVVG